ncbi:MAG TPA: trehalose-6-phosphate synthase, partial [Terriglobales bacterium]|nr:trehalose-6-phosphate synthase [Terriglobales bacterium]
NRIPISFRQENGKLVAEASAGGLVTALEPVLQQHGGMWVGNAGTQDSLELQQQLDAATKGGNFRYVPVILTDEEQTKYYEGFSNEVLWPLFHDLQSLCHFDPEYWDFYERVNRKFAEVTNSTSEQSDLVWIQDYQLLRVAHFLRENRPDALISFFLHIPFPPPDIFAKLPWRREVLEGLLDYNFIGVQTPRDERNLTASVRSFLPSAKITGHKDQKTILTARSRTRIRAIPISIDFKDFSAAANSEAVVERVESIRKQAAGMEIAIGIDRLDYTKGIPERMRAFRAFLRLYPHFSRKLTLIQVVVPSREGILRYKDLLSDIERLISAINGEFAEPGWTPIQYMHRSVAHDELLALYRSAGIALVTPLKDGMNLVAKEYCAARVDNTGVLILSEFAGAMPELRTGAIAVHPYDELGIAEALRQALQMPNPERRRRMLRMRRQIQQSDILRWRDHNFEQIQQRQEPSTKLAA